MADVSERHRVLVYDQMARNRLTTWLLLAAFPLALLPIALGLARGLRLPVINKIFWSYAGPQLSRRELLVHDLLWGQGVDAKLRTVQVMIAASILVGVVYVAYRYAGLT